MGIIFVSVFFDFTTEGRLKNFQTAFAKAIKKGCRSSLFEQMFAD
jgi:hypothetical protein